MNNDEYISVESLINTDYDNNQIDIPSSYISVYQIQGQSNTPLVKIVEVGHLDTVHDIIINQFSLEDNLKCIIIGCIYDIDLLHKLCFDIGTISIIKILICNNDNPIGSINYTFNNKKSTTSGYNELNGYFSVVFYYKDIEDKMIILETFDNHMDNNEIFDKLISYLCDQNILNIINKIKK